MKVSLTVVVALALALCVYFDDVDAQRGKLKGKRKGVRRFGRKRGRGFGRRRIGGRGPFPHPVPPGPVHPPVIEPGHPFPRDCGPIPHLTNGFAIEAGSAVQYACQPGFRLEGTNEITCIDGRWTVAPRCVRQVCPRPQNVAFATITEISNGGASAVFTCNAGYKITGTGLQSQRVHCNTATQQWGILPTCSQSHVNPGCHSPPVIVNARSTLSGNIATYTCVETHKPKPGTPSQIQCVNNQWPTTNLPECIPKVGAVIRCNNPPPCGNDKISREPAADSYAVGEKVLYTCVSGYKIAGQNSNDKMTENVECKEDGTWTATPVCDPKMCPDVTFGSNNVQTQPPTKTFGTQYTYQCIANYEPASGTAGTTTTCGADGIWSLIPPPNCIAKSCPYSAVPESVTKNANTIPTDGGVAVGESLTITCLPNFRVAPGNPASTINIITIACNTDETWATTGQSCVSVNPKDCKDYFARDNLFASAAIGSVTVTVDPDGANTGTPPYAVQCVKKSSTECCTEVTPTTNTVTGLNACTSSTDNTVMPGVTLGTNNGFCGSTTLTYGLSTEALTNLVTHNNNCQQKVNIACTGADGVYAIVKTAEQTRGKGYNAVGAGVEAATDVTTYTTNNLLSDVCDCHDSGCAASGCTCSAIDGVGTGDGDDTITFSLDGTNGWVTAIGRASKGSGGIADIIAGEYDVTANEISCCEVFHM